MREMVAREAIPSWGNPGNYLFVLQGFLIRGLYLQAIPTCSACRTSSKGQTIVWKGSGALGRPVTVLLCMVL